MLGYWWLRCKYCYSNTKSISLAIVTHPQVMLHGCGSGGGVGLIKLMPQHESLFENRNLNKMLNKKR